MPFRFSLSRPISAEDIRSTIRAQNLNKTNQYSNPPLSLADSPSVPFSAFFFPSFFIYFYPSLFPAAPSASSSRVSFSFAPILHSLVQYRSVSFIRVFFAESGDLLSRPFQPLYSLGFNSPNDWFYTWRTAFVLSAEKKKKYKMKNLFEDNEKIKCDEIGNVRLSQFLLRIKLDFYSSML